MRIIKLLTLLICIHPYAQDKLTSDPITTSSIELNINPKTIYNKQVNIIWHLINLKEKNSQNLLLLQI